MESTLGTTETTRRTRSKEQRKKAPGVPPSPRASSLAMAVGWLRVIGCARNSVGAANSLLVRKGNQGRRPRGLNSQEEQGSKPPASDALAAFGTERVDGSWWSDDLRGRWHVGHLMRRRDPLRGDPAASSTCSPAMALTRAHAGERGGRRRRATVRFQSCGSHVSASKRYRFNLNRPGKIWRPTRGHAVPTGAGAVSWLGSAQRLEPNAQWASLGFDFWLKLWRFNWGIKWTPKFMKFLLELDTFRINLP